MSKMEDGGPAFPTKTMEAQDNEIVFTKYHGLSIRDWFAGQALVGFGLGTLSDAYTMKLASDTAYAIADQMLAARKTGGQS